MNNVRSSPKFATNARGDGPGVAVGNTQTFSQIVLRVVKHLGPLLREAFVYLWKILLDVATGVQLGWRRWQARRDKDNANRFEVWRAALRERRVARWAPWHALTTARRMEVRLAAALLVLVVLLIARAWVLPPIGEAPVTPTADAADPPVARPVASRLPTVDAEAEAAARRAVAAFAADRERISAGEWAVLRDPPAFERGPLGAWDDYVVGSQIVMKEEGKQTKGSDGARFRMWYRGCHLALGEHACGLGHATSVDGVIWEKRAEPVFMPADPLLRDGFDEIAVVKAEGRYLLWYSVMGDPFKGRRRATVHLATSADGIVWTDEGQVMEGANDATLFITHSAYYDGRNFHLWYVHKILRAASTVLEHFVSADGNTWTDEGGTATVDLESKPSIGMGRLMIVAVMDGEFLALFIHDFRDQSRHVLGSMTSPDGTTWTEMSIDEDPLMAGPKQEIYARALSGVLDQDGLWLWMTLRSLQGPAHIGVAFRKGDGS